MIHTHPKTDDPALLIPIPSVQARQLAERMPLFPEDYNVLYGSKSHRPIPQNAGMAYLVSILSQPKAGNISWRTCKCSLTLQSGFRFLQ